jgi:hypothetical protein
MCESWIYGCGHAVRTPCPRPKPTVPTAISSTNTSGSAGSNVSNTHTSTQSSSRRNSSTTTTSSLLSLPPISKFCNGFPPAPKETSSPCYNCILAAARLKIALEKPEVEAKKHELLRNSMARTTSWGPGGRYADEFGNKIVAEEEDELEYGAAVGWGASQGQGRERGVTTAVGPGLGNWDGSGMFGGSGYAGGDHGVHSARDRCNSAGGASNAGTNAFRGGRGGGFPRSFADYCASHNSGNSGHQDGIQKGHGQPRGADLPLNGFGPRRNRYSSQNGGHPNGYTNNNGYGQQHFTNDFGGIAWGQSGGGLDYGTNQLNARRF